MHDDYIGAGWAFPLRTNTRGGIALVRFGDYGWMWYADMLLALAAAFINLPIRELFITRTSQGRPLLGDAFSRSRDCIVSI